eukprot:TRINITY_DN17427_c0_g1_i1.p1 TRINITY_DN17427_c0_g1~~TRINITY_DN17427_c0_g1_i1.p1  ORF type:complete len:384 (+),score=16.67 TRINITY_DN17427_c0_g1_i1:121-1272(+)
MQLNNIQYDKFLAIWCFIGITASILLYGVIQERVMTVQFGNEYFSYSLFLVLCNRIATCFAALSVLLFLILRFFPAAPLHKYAMISFANVIATTAQYETLKYLNFPMQTLSKCAKMIPVMIWGTVISRKIYKKNQYLEAFLIFFGSGLFVFSGDVSSRVPNDDSSVYIGVVLMMLYLVFDGFTSTWQDRLFTQYNMDLCNQMLYSTIFSTMISWVGLFGQNQLNDVFNFLGRHPGVWWWILGTAITAISVQFFINYTIKKYGAFVFATIMTTRQFLSIFLSVLLFGHRVGLLQWLGTFVVFGALYHHILGRQNQNKNQSQLLPIRSRSSSPHNSIINQYFAEDKQIKDTSKIGDFLHDPKQFQNQLQKEKSVDNNGEVLVKTS